MNRCLHTLLLISVLVSQNHHVASFSPSFGLGAVFFQPKGLITSSTKGQPQKLQQASDFFVDAFWVGKAGGGPKAQLNDRQRRSLGTTQYMEFRGRYAGDARGQSELVICQLPDGEVIGCAGIEVSPIPNGNLQAMSKKRAPLMSNLAVSRKYRRKGIGELLVKEAERLARLEWGADDCYLYVEQRNAAAVKLYQKLGYRKVWVDKDAKTLIPTSNGNLINEPTQIVCMRKRLNMGLLGRLWPF
jgi:ribosomal protein S18 acetylase RimI-like enzyme